MGQTREVGVFIDVVRMWTFTHLSFSVSTRIMHTAFSCKRGQNPRGGCRVLSDAAYSCKRGSNPRYGYHVPSKYFNLPRDDSRIVVFDGVECCVLQLTGFLVVVVDWYRTEVEVIVLVEIQRKAMWLAATISRSTSRILIGLRTYRRYDVTIWVIKSAVWQ